MTVAEVCERSTRQSLISPSCDDKMVEGTVRPFKSPAWCHNGLHRPGRCTQCITDVTKTRFVDIDDVTAIGLFQEMIKEALQIVYYSIPLIQTGRGEKINPVFIPGEGQYLQGQTTKLKAVVPEENAQGIQMQLQMRAITGTNLRTWKLIL